MKKQKKILFVIPLLLIVLVFCGFKEDQKVFDQADLLSANEENELQNQILEIANHQELDIVIVTTDNADGKTSEEYADDFFDYNGFGYDKPMGTGILYLIDMDNRNAWISTSGGAITYFTDKRIDDILSDIQPLLKNQSYQESCKTFLNYVDKYMNNLPDEKNLYDYEGNTRGFHFSLGLLLVSLFVALFISLVVTLLLVGHAGGSVVVNSQTYLNKNAVKINGQTDQFIRKEVTSHTISSNDSGGSSGGASSTHSSSSGNTHGGGGCSF